MKKVDLVQAVQLIANIGVIAGIVFLGVELRQNNELLDYQRQLSSLELNLTDIDLLISEPDLRNAVGKDLLGERMSEDDEALVGLMQSKIYQTLEWQYLENPQSRERIRRAIIQSGGSRVEPTVWARLKPSLDPSFVEFAEDAMKQREQK